jgi:hypothetical protein
MCVLINICYGTLCRTLHIYQAISYDSIFASSLYVCQAKISMRIIRTKIGERVLQISTITF